MDIQNNLQAEHGLANDNTAREIRVTANCTNFLFWIFGYDNTNTGIVNDNRLSMIFLTFSVWSHKMQIAKPNVICKVIK